MSALSLRRAPVLRRVLAGALAAVYCLPLGIGAVSDLSHGAFHALERLGALQAEAAALGLVHLGEHSFTHTHGGVTHSHAGAVDALLVAADQADEGAEASAPLVKLSAHTPAAVVQAVIVQAVSRASALVDPSAPPSPRALPPVPPPRA